MRPGSALSRMVCKLIAHDWAILERYELRGDWHRASVFPGCLTWQVEARAKMCCRTCRRIEIRETTLRAWGEFPPRN